MIKLNREGAVQEIVIDRPERRNALDRAMVEDLANALATAAGDAQCRCLVLKGTGAHFCAGRDLSGEEEAQGLNPTLARDELWSGIFKQLHRLAVPSVAVVRGYAVAGGFTLAMGCDFVLAERGAKFGAMEMKNGFPAAVNTPILSRLLPPRMALELLVFGDPVGAGRLYEMGLINRLCEDGDDLAAVEAAFVEALLALDPVAIALTKEVHHAALAMPHENALDMGKHLNALLAASGRMAEGAAQFAARQKQRKE